MMFSTKARLISTTFLFMSGSALAQTALPATGGAQGTVAKGTTANGKLEQVTVTATRRRVNLQKVTATVEAVTAATLKAANITGVIQLPQLVSGLVVTPSGGNNVYIRGIGSPSTGYNEAQVAVYVDGVYLANPATGIYSFNNIDRIEVLKGPQGTLYGRNVTGGLISVTTRDPGPQQHLDASVGYASYDTLTTNLYASTPITDDLAANIAVYHSHQSQGWSRDIFNNSTVQKSNETGVESKVVWKPTSTTKVTGSFIFDYNNRNLGYATQPYPGTLGNDGTPNFGHYLVDERQTPKAPFDSYIGSLHIEQDLGFASLSSLTAYQTSHEKTFFEGGSPDLGYPISRENAIYDTFYQHNKTWSQEFQLTSKPSTSRLDWIVGAFYYNDSEELRLDDFPTCLGQVCVPGLVPERSDGFPKTKSYSGFGDATYRLFDATRVTLGLRYTNETRTLSGLNSALPGLPDSQPTLPAGTVLYPGQPFNGFPNGIPTSLNFSQVTYRGVVSQDFGPNVRAYLADNLGFKSGAFNANSFINPPVKPELLYDYEAGFKAESSDHTLRLNAAYFHYRYDNVQLRSMQPPALPGNAILENAAKERQDGVDADFAIAATNALTINGSFEYLRAKFVNFPGTTCATAGTKVDSSGKVVGASTVIPCNLAGATVPFAPPITLSIGFTYRYDTTIGQFAFNANDHFNSDYPMVADNSIRQASHNIVDLNLVWTSPNSRYDVNFYANNLIGEYYYAAALEGASFGVVPGAPRTLGGTLGVHF